MKKNYERKNGSLVKPVRRSKYRGEDWIGRGERLRNERKGVYPDWTKEK